jgi:hypothetical protein
VERWHLVIAAKGRQADTGTITADGIDYRIDRLQREANAIGDRPP